MQPSSLEGWVSFDDLQKLVGAGYTLVRTAIAAYHLESRIRYLGRYTYYSSKWVPALQFYIANRVTNPDLLPPEDRPAKE